MELLLKLLILEMFKLFSRLLERWLVNPFAWIC